MTLRLRRAGVLTVIGVLALACDRGTGSAAPSASSSASAAPLVDFDEPPPAASSASPAAPPASATPSTAAAEDKPRAAPRPGLAGEVFDRARALELSDEQKSKLETVETRLWGAPRDDEETRSALKGFFAALLDGVKKGHVVESQLAPYYATLERIAKTRRDAEARALDELHALLEPEQRKELVEALARRYPSAAEKPQAARAGGKPGAPAPLDVAKRADRARKRLARVTRLLGLDEAQQKRVQPILARYDAELRNRATREARAKRRRAFLVAFEKDAFDATRLDLGRGPRERMKDRVDYIVTLLSILRVDQRDDLARSLERPGARRWGGAVAGDVGPIDDE